MRHRDHRPSRTSAQSPGVTWTNIVNAAANGSDLQKNAGCDGCDDAGAARNSRSVPTASSNLPLVNRTPSGWPALITVTRTTYINDIDFAFRFNGAGYADVLESGAYQLGGDTTYTTGDVFRIAIVGGRVQYSKNGQFLRESAAAPGYPLEPGRDARQRSALQFAMRSSLSVRLRRLAEG